MKIVDNQLPMEILIGPNYTKVVKLSLPKSWKTNSEEIIGEMFLNKMDWDNDGKEDLIVSFPYYSNSTNVR